MKKAFCSWSGGKDSAMALFRAQKMGNLDITHCLNTITEDGVYSRSHGIRTEILRKQVESMDLKILQVPTTWETYEAKFKEAITQLKKEGIEAGIFGDIDLEPHREWVERVCGEMGIEAHLPLWLEKRETLMNEFIDNGFEAVVTAAVAAKMGKEWLGRAIDKQFIHDLSQHPDIDLCGEKGEYHTLVTNAPYLKQPIVVQETDPQLVGEHWFLNVTGFALGTA